MEEQKKGEQQRALLATVLTSSPDAIWFEDEQGCILAANPRFASVIGSNAAELVGKTMRDILPPDLWEEIYAYSLQAKLTRLPLYTEENVTFADGHNETMEVVRTPLYDASGKYQGMLGCCRNVSLRVDVERQLRNTQAQLESAVQDANRASSSKSAFLARMSHEIRTPMNAIIGLAGITLRRLQADDPPPVEEIRHQVDQIEQFSLHLLGLLNDILDISKIEAGKIELLPEPFDLFKTADEVATIIEQRCVEKNIQFSVIKENLSTNVYISDALRLRQVLINLLGNAVKFTPEKGAITFTIRGLEEKEDQSLVEFSVTDSGIGISPEVREKLFLPFEQGSVNVSKTYGGTGLGLAISRSIVNMLGGDIAIQSDLGHGSEFSFSIWLAKDDAGKLENLNGSEDVFPGKRLLLVDDVAINRLIVREQLSGTGLDIEEAENGEDALEKFKDSPEGYYDAILMDVQMPRMDGYECVTAIRNLDRTDAATVPVIAMTANAFKEDVEEALAHGMNAHLAKPVEIEKVTAVLNKFLGQ
jgi:PAS domain S-box-containing protein